MLIKLIITGLIAIAASGLRAQQLKPIEVPRNVKAAFETTYPKATKITWEREKGNYEANWGGKSGEENSVVYTPTAVFVEIVKAIPINTLPKSIAPYVKAHYSGAKIREAAKVTNAAGKTLYEAEIKGADLIFDEHGNFIKKD